MNYFLSSLTCLLWPGAITFGSSETKGRTGSSLVGSSEYNTVFLDIPFDCYDFEIRWDAFGGERHIDVLGCSCFVFSGVRGWGEIKDNG